MNEVPVIFRQYPFKKKSAWIIIFQQWRTTLLVSCPTASEQHMHVSVTEGSLVMEGSLAYEDIIRLVSATNDVGRLPC